MSETNSNKVAVGDLADGTPFFGGKRNNKPGESETTQMIDDANYRMDHGRRGKAVIFNHEKFESDHKTRAGTEKDARKIAMTLETIGFDVEMCNDFTVSKLKKKMADVSSEDHSDADCLVIVVMTHGEPDRLYALDDSYPTKTLWKKLVADKAPTLAGKPKIFFIQACRGRDVDDGTRLTAVSHLGAVYTQTDGVLKKVSYTIPNTSDLLICHSTFDGHFSWRNPEAGSWYIQTLSDELLKNWEKEDLLSMMTNVNRHVAIRYTSNVTENEDMDQKKQMPNFYSTLTRKLYFGRKGGRETRV